MVVQVYTKVNVGMAVLVIGLLALVIGLGALGCKLGGSLAIGPKDWQLLKIEYKGEGMGTFCWEGAGYHEIGIMPVGWGPDECTRSELGPIRLPD